MKIRRAVYQGVMYPKISHLIGLKFSLKSCATLSEGRFVAFYAKEKRLRPAIED